MKDRKKFQEYMTLLGELFDKEITATLASAYWTILERYDDQEVESAFKAIISSSRFFPKPVDLLEAINGKENEASLHAWTLIEKAMRTRGPEDSIRFLDKAIHSTVELMGGWPVLCATPTQEEWKWKRHEFQKIYPTMQKKKDHPEYLPGTYEGISDRVYGEIEIHLITDNGDKPQLTEGNDGNLPSNS